MELYFYSHLHCELIHLYSKSYPSISRPVNSFSTPAISKEVLKLHLDYS